MPGTDGCGLDSSVHRGAMQRKIPPYCNRLLSRVRKDQVSALPIFTSTMRPRNGSCLTQWHFLTCLPLFLVKPRGLLHFRQTVFGSLTLQQNLFAALIYLKIYGRPCRTD